MKAQLPDTPQQPRRPWLARLWFLARVSVVGLAAFAVRSLHANDAFKDFEDAIYGLIHRVAWYEREAPTSVVIVSYLDYSPTYGGDHTWPKEEVLVEGLRKIARSSPKYVFNDARSGPQDTTPAELEALRLIAKTAPTAFASYVSRGLKDRLVLEPEPSLLEAGISFTHDTTVQKATDFSFDSREIFPKRGLLDAWEQMTGERLPAATERSMIRYYAPPGTIRNITLSKLATMSDEEAEAILKGRVVFLGFQTLPWLSPRVAGDIASNVYAHEISTTEVRATIVANMVDGSHVRVPSKEISDLLVYSVLGLLFAKVLNSGGLDTFRFLVGYAVTVLQVPIIIVVWFGVWIPGMATLFVGALAALFVTDVVFASGLGENPGELRNFGRYRF